MKILFTALALVFASSLVAQGKLYKVTDEYGNVSYQDTRPSNTDSYEESALDPVPVDEGSKRRVDLLLAEQNFPLILFSVKKCDACDFVRWFLQNRDVPLKNSMSRWMSKTNLNYTKLQENIGCQCCWWGTKYNQVSTVRR